MRLFASLLILLIASLSDASLVRAAEPQKSDVVETFRRNMLPDEASADGLVRKWSKDIRLTVLTEKGADPRLVELVGSTFRQIEELTPVQVRYVTDRPNFVVIFVDNLGAEIENYREILKYTFADEADFNRYIAEAKASRRHYLTFRATNPQSEIAIFCMVVSIQREPFENELSPENYLLRGILNGIGLGTGNVDTLSVFNARLDLRVLSDIDKVLVKTFYAPTIAPNMPMSSAGEAFESALDAAAFR